MKVFKITNPCKNQLGDNILPIVHRKIDKNPKNDKWTIFNLHNKNTHVNAIIKSNDFKRTTIE